MEWIFGHWKIVLIGVVALTVVAGLIAGGTWLFPSGETIKGWSVQEAVFYGFCLLAFATLIGR